MKMPERWCSLCLGIEPGEKYGYYAMLRSRLVTDKGDHSMNHKMIARSATFAVESDEVPLLMLDPVNDLTPEMQQAYDTGQALQCLLGE